MTSQTSTTQELGATDILSADDMEIVLVEVPEWGGHVFIKTLTGAERDAFEAGMIETRGKSREVNIKNIRASLVAACACTADGGRLFTISQTEALGLKAAKPLDRIFSVASKMNGISEEDVEELAEDFSDTDGSPSDSSSLES